MTRRPTSVTEPETEAASPPRTHNQPAKPSCPPPEEIRAWLETEHQPLTDRRQEIVAGYLTFVAKNPTIKTEAAQAVATDLLKAITTFVKEAVAGHTAAKAPYLAAGQTVDGFFNVLTQNADEKSKLPMVTKDKNGRSIQNSLKGLMTDFAEALAAERRREAEEEAKKKAAEAQRLLDEAAAKMTSESLDVAAEAARVAEKAEQLAAAPAAQHSRVHGDFGGVSSLRTTWEFTVEDPIRLMQAIVAPTLMMPDLRKAVEDAIPAAIAKETLPHVAAILTALCSAWVGPVPVVDTFMVPDAVRIRRAVVSDNVRDIPGVRIFQRRSV